jgi:hypothetical protein
VVVNTSERILKCCHSYQEKLDVETIAMLTNLPEDVVSKNLDELKKAEKLPKQYLSHRLN